MRKLGRDGASRDHPARTWPAKRSGASAAFRSRGPGSPVFRGRRCGPRRLESVGDMYGSSLNFKRETERRAARGAHARPRRAWPHCVARLRISARISPSVAAGNSVLRITSFRQPSRHTWTARTKPRCRRARAPRPARPIAARRRAPAWRQRESPWAAQMARRVSAAACSCRRRRAARLHWASTVSSSRLREKSAAPAWCRNASESATLAEAIVPVPRPLIGALRGTETALECGAPPRANRASPMRHGEASCGAPKTARSTCSPMPAGCQTRQLSPRRAPTAATPPAATAASCGSARLPPAARAAKPAARAVANAARRALAARARRWPRAAPAARRASTAAATALARRAARGHAPWPPLPSSQCQPRAAASPSPPPPPPPPSPLPPLSPLPPPSLRASPPPPLSLPSSPPPPSLPPPSPPPLLPPSPARLL
eukprot:scaffold33924_cov60-Phaeocystis_antarctica.AAC.3